MALVYQITEEELKHIHLREVHRLLRARLANLLLPWRWLRPKPVPTWYTWDTLVTACSRHEGFTVAHTERGQEINYRLYRPSSPAMPLERWLRNPNL
jgi:hypothetical protein